MATLIFFKVNSAFSANFSDSQCSFSENWTQLTTNSFTTDIEYSTNLFKELSTTDISAPDNFVKYSKAFDAFQIKDPYSRLRSARFLWSKKINNQSDINGILLTIDSILESRLGKIRNVNCLEWGLFQKGAVAQNIDLNVPLFLELSWSIWRKENILKIVMELGETAIVKSNMKYFDELYKYGWTQLYDIHNHPALQKHPTYTGDHLGPELYPSPSDARYWGQTIKWGNKFASITDGLTSLEVSSVEFEPFRKQYFCAKYPDYHSCH